LFDRGQSEVAWAKGESRSLRMSTASYGQSEKW